MNIIDTEIPDTWLEGATLDWVWNNADEKSDGGTPVVVPRQTRPLQQWSFDVWMDDVVAVENLMILCNGSANGFFARPPIARYYTTTAQALGTATGGPQAFQLKVVRGSTSWDSRYPVAGSVVLYANGTPLVETSDWTLGSLGAGTVTATVGQTLTADHVFKTPFKFVGNSLSIEANATFQMPRSVTIEEIP